MNCFSCKSFSALVNPRDVGGAIIYGYCFKKSRLYQSVDHKGYPVYISKGHCKDHSEAGKQVDGQIDLFERIRENGEINI